MSDENFLLNAPDGVARYEATRDLLRGDPATVIPRLEKMLEDGTARYPSEIKELLEIIKAGRADEVLEKWTFHSHAPSEPPRPRTEAERIEALVKSVGDPLRVNQPSAERAHRKLVEIGAAAVPALVTRLHDDRAKKRRFGLLKVLGEIAAQGDESALEAIKAAGDHEDRSIAGPAGAVLKQLQTDD